MALNVPEIWYKSKRVLRTVVQVGIPAFITFALVLPQIIDAAGLPVDSALYIQLIAIAAGVTAVAGGLARIMAIPAVNAWLLNIGLGSVPKADAAALAASERRRYRETLKPLDYGQAPA